MALPWGAFLFCTCTCSLLQLDPVEASEAGGLHWDCEEDAEGYTAPGLLSELLGLMDDSVVTATPDNECVFPFTFGNEKHFDCIDHPLLYSWCSLTGKYSGKWKYCTDDDRARCVFPFIFEGHVYKDCITKGSLFRMAWCSLSPNYDQDHAWKYCY